MEEKQEEKLLLHVCRICDKQFTSDGSLGDHMRKHFVSDQQNEDPKMTAPSGNDQNVRLKKSQKVSSLHVCKVCGKEFHSPNALFGHLRIHSAKHKSVIRCEICGKEFGSVKSLINHRGLHSIMASEELRVCSSPNVSQESSKGTETLNLVWRRRSEKNKYNMTSSSCSSFSSSHGSSSFVTKIQQEEMEEVAGCLIMLSEGFYDSGAFRNVSPGDDSVEVEIKSLKHYQKRPKTDDHCCFGSDHRSLKLKRPGNLLISQCLDSSSGVIGKETDKDIESDFWDLDEEQEKIKTGILVDNAAVYELKPKSSELQTYPGFIKSNSCWISGLNAACDTEHVAIPSRVINKSQKNSQDSSEYECRACQKVFGCHQALGGHQRLHRSRRCHVGSKNVSFEGNSRPSCNVSGTNKTEVVENLTELRNVGLNEHKCWICPKIFATEHALRFHERLHPSKELRINQEQYIAERGEIGVLFDAIDLNLPAMTDEESFNDLDNQRLL